MGFRVVLIESNVGIHLKLNNLVINTENRDIWIPIEDISILILDNTKITLTARMLSYLAEYNIGVILCNQEHLPMGFYSSYDNHSRISKCIGYQIHASYEFYQYLWQKIVQAKITNQAKVLQLLQKDEDAIRNVKSFCEEIEPGDSTNREAHAAKVYFNTLMRTSFSRGNDELLLNSGLNYGYTIFRSLLARLCVGYGLNSQLGIHHCNEYNRFNLVDDMIEPFRPFVDYYAYLLLKEEEYFKREHRHKLVNLLNHQLRYKNKKMYLSNAMEEYVSGMAAYIAGKKEKIEFPDMDNYLGEEDEI